MFRSQPYLKNTTYIQINLHTPLTFPGNNQYQTKSGYKFTVKDRDNFYDWYNAYFRVNFKFEAVANGANIGADTESAPINSSFSLIKSLKLNSAGKNCTRRTISTKVFSSKILIFRTIFREAWQKTSFGILTLTPPRRLITMRRTLECEQGRFYHMKVR